MRSYVLSIAAATLLLSACNNPEAAVAGATSDNPSSDILYTDRDTTVSPREDFFDYANGGWIKRNPIPDDQSAWTIGHAIQEDIYKRLRDINEKSLSATSGVDEKVGNFWWSAMDSAGSQQQGLQPIAPELNAIAASKDLKGLLDVVADLQVKGIGAGFNPGVYQDAKNSDVMALYLNQGGLGLPNRDYYFNNDARTAGIRNAYTQYVRSVFAALGSDSLTAMQQAATHVALETRLAKSSRKLEDLRDPYRNYNKMTVADLGKLCPAIDWPALLRKEDVTGVDSVIVGQPEFYVELDATLRSTPLPVLQDYVRFHLVRATAPYHDSTTYGNYFNFYGKTIRGAKVPKARWKRMLDLQDGLMGEALGKVFVEEFFPKEAKERYSRMVEDIRAALKDRIEKLDWMSDSTKQKAYTKLASMKKKVGYPDKWKDFSAMKIERQPLVRNVFAANSWWHHYEVNKLGKPVDRDEWEMNPQTYNAYYNPSNNEIVLPAGIFTVPGYRDNQLDDALVYGYAGATTIGHEITHGFDDEGRQYDEKGNLNAWWTPKDSAEFAQRAAMMVKQFNEYVVVDTARINGKATLGENIADLGGALLGLDAFKKTDTYKSGKLINGMTPLQRYFLGYALGWLGHTRQEELANRLLTDVHSPAKWRVNGPFVNVPEFYEAFGIKPGDKMYRADSLRVRIW
ncbi:MAG: M13 family peptidase [Chitinophagaceae bacterium]|nr:MAG: M13 family peptidase [Chitinophagaceae bacterium]